MTVIEEAESLVNGDRAEAYGNAIDDATRFVNLLNAMYKDALKVTFVPKDYAIIMILVKLDREMYKHKRDNIVDIIGYAQVLARCVGDDPLPEGCDPQMNDPNPRPGSVMPIDNKWIDNKWEGK